MTQAPITLDVPAKNEDEVQVYLAALFEAQLNGYRPAAARKRAWRALVNHRKKLAKEAGGRQEQSLHPPPQDERNGR